MNKLLNQVNVLITTDGKSDKGDFSHTLSQPICGFKSVEIQAVNFPNALHNINEYNNKLYWNDHTTTAITSTIPVGNYDIDSLITEINNQLANDKTDANTYLIENIANTVTGLKVQNKLKFYANASNNMALRDGSNSILDILGFPSSSASANSHIATRTFNLTVSYVLLEHNIPIENGLFFNTNRRDAFLIQLDKGYGQVSNNQNVSTQVYKLRKNAGINKLSFQLRDLNYNLLDNEGVDYNFMLTFYK